MEELSLERNQKGVIARLLLQRTMLWYEHDIREVENSISDVEVSFVINNTTPGDIEIFSDIYNIVELFHLERGLD